MPSDFLDEATAVSRSRVPTGGRASSAPGVVRIIGGDWRGTRLPVADRQGLRPTADRVRETVFNWLQPKLPGARVLDLFAGTGALGLEALSRGAREAVLIERDRDLAESLRQSIAKLPGGERAQVICADALSWLRAGSLSASGFDVIFLDPPFAGDAQSGLAQGGLWQPALAALAPWLADDAWLYLESPQSSAAQPHMNPGAAWQLHRQGLTREVHYAVYRRVQ